MPSDLSPSLCRLQHQLGEQHRAPCRVRRRHWGRGRRRGPRGPPAGRLLLVATAGTDGPAADPAATTTAAAAASTGANTGAAGEPEEQEPQGDAEVAVQERDVDSLSSVGPFRLPVCASIHQDSHNLGIPVPCGDVEGCAQAPLCPIHVGPSLAQEPDHLCTSAPSCHVQWSGSVCIQSCPIFVRFFIQQQPDNCTVAIQSCHVQRRPTVCVNDVGVRPRLQSQRCSPMVTVLSCIQKCRAHLGVVGEHDERENDVALPKQFVVAHRWPLTAAVRSDLPVDRATDQSQRRQTWGRAAEPASCPATAELLLEACSRCRRRHPPRRQLVASHAVHLHRRFCVIALVSNLRGSASTGTSAGTRNLSGNNGAGGGSSVGGCRRTHAMGVAPAALTPALWEGRVGYPKKRS
mmetsp:Transcript_165153/g.524710  ORF Transcript_165153/g.524710 Transcript_165153/m.524710 type:complete len:406 (+) Transcript_165153:89-1306(+)